MSNLNNSINITRQEVVWNPIAINKNKISWVRIPRENKWPLFLPDYTEVTHNVYFLISIFLVLAIIYEMGESKDKQVKWTYISVFDEPEVSSRLQTCAKPNKKCSCKEHFSVFPPPVIMLNSPSGWPGSDSNAVRRWRRSHTCSQEAHSLPRHMIYLQLTWHVQ